MARLIGRFSVLLFILAHPSFTSLVKSQDAEVVEYSTDVYFDNTQVSKRETIVIKINNRNGDKYSSITLPYTKDEKISNIEGNITDKYGNIVRKLKKSEIITRSDISDGSFYEDDFVKEFTLRYNSYPYNIQYSYDISYNRYLFFEGWFPVIAYNIPTRNAVLSLTLPLDCRFRVKSKNIDPPVPKEERGVVIWTWTTTFTGFDEKEPLAPPTTEYLPSVLIIPELFNFEIGGSQKDWTQFGNWQYDILRTKNDLSIRDKKFFNSMVGDLSSDLDKVRKLYHYLQDNTRYINISLETGGLVPYPASYVSTNKYGDCKALTNYFKAVLESVGINSYYSIVYAGDNPVRIDTSLTFSQFNHIILYVPLEEDTLWLDCTSKGPFGYLGTFTQDRYALVVDYNNSRLIRTPSLTIDDVKVSRVINLEYSDGNSVVASINNKYRGEEFEAIQYISKDFNESQQSVIMKEYVLPGIYDVLTFIIDQHKRDEKEISLRAGVKIANLYQKFGNDYIASYIPLSLPVLKSPEERKFAIAINYPVYYSDTIKYFTPPGYRLNSNIGTRNIINEFGEFTIDTKLVDGSIIIAREYILYPGIHPKERFKDLIKFFSEIREIEKSSSLAFTKY